MNAVTTDPYKLLAPLYERYHDRATQRVLMQWVVTTLPRGRVVDCGAGTGIVGRYLAHKGYTVTLMDTSAAMLDEARQRAIEEGVSIRIEVHDVRESFQETFDHAIAMMDVINHFPEPADVSRFFHNIYTHLEADGYFIFDTLKSSYITSLEGYSETFPEKPPLTWKARLIDECRVEHTFTQGSIQHTLIEQSFEPNTLETWFKPWFEQKQKIEHDDRWIYILQKKNTP